MECWEGCTTPLYYTININRSIYFQPTGEMESSDDIDLF